MYLYTSMSATVAYDYVKITLESCFMSADNQLSINNALLKGKEISYPMHNLHE